MEKVGLVKQERVTFKKISIILKSLVWFNIRELTSKDLYIIHIVNNKDIAIKELVGKAETERDLFRLTKKELTDA